jgi:GntR family transcriptional regulator
VREEETMPRTLDRRGDRPLYLQIADDLRAEIDDQRLGQGERAPSEHSLMGRYGASRDTVRKAIAVLRTEGHLDAERGRGVYVRRNGQVTRLSSDRLGRRNRKGPDPGATPAPMEMNTRREKASPAVADRLALREGEPVLVLHWRIGEEGKARQLATSRLSLRLVDGSPLEQTNAGPEATYSLLEELGYRLGRFAELVSARMPTPDEARALGISPGTPVLCVARTAYTKLDDRPIEICDTVMAAAGFELQYDVPGK